MDLHAEGPCQTALLRMNVCAVTAMTTEQNPAFWWWTVHVKHGRRMMPSDRCGGCSGAGESRVLIFTYKILGTQMDWIAERRALRSLKCTPERNSSLKKKLSIINRLRNIAADNWKEIMDELQNENLQKFYTEIINSLMQGVRSQRIGDVYNAVRVICLYSWDQLFLAQLMAVLKKAYTESWAHGAVFAEVYYIVNGEVNGLTKGLVKAYGDASVLMISYLLSNFEGLDTVHIKKRVRELLADVNSKNIELLQGICEKLGWEDRLEVKSDYVEVIKTLPDEFAFYKRSAETARPQRAFVPADVKKIESEAKNGPFLDFVGAGIAGRPELLGKVLRKKKAPYLIPAIARIVSGAGAARKAVIWQLLADVQEGISNNELALLGELYKFGEMRASDMMNALTFYLKNRNTERLCVLMEHVGRHMLLSQETNAFARRLVDRMKQTGGSEIERLLVGDCLAKIFHAGALKVGITGFFHWFFQRKNFTREGIYKRIVDSRRMLLILILQPELFEDVELLVEIIQSTGLIEAVADLYIKSIGHFIRASRHAAFRIIDALAALIGSSEVERQRLLISRMWGLSIPLDVRYRGMITILERANPSTHQQYVQQLAKLNVPAEPRFIFLNFLEKYNYDCVSDNCEEDSFEREIAFLR